MSTYFCDYQSYVIHPLIKPGMDIVNKRKQQLLQTYIFFQDRIFQGWWTWLFQILSSAAEETSSPPSGPQRPSPPPPPGHARPTRGFQAEGWVLREPIKRRNFGAKSPQTLARRILRNCVPFCHSLQGLWIAISCIGL